VILALTDNLALVIVVNFVGGVATCAVNPAIHAMMYQRIPPHLLARVAGISIAVMFGGLPLGPLLGGATVQGLDYASAVLLFAAAYFVSTLVPVFGYHTWRELNDSTVKSVPSSEVAELPRTHGMGRSAAGLRITLRYAAGQWRIDARHGVRPLTFRHPVEPKRALEGLAQLNLPPVHAAVREVMAGDRERIERETQRVRTELAAIQAALGAVGAGPGGRVTA
jgi:MFS family permease